MARGPVWTTMALSGSESGDGGWRRPEVRGRRRPGPSEASLGEKRMKSVAKVMAPRLSVQAGVEDARARGSGRLVSRRLSMGPPSERAVERARREWLMSRVPNGSGERGGGPCRGLAVDMSTAVVPARR